MTKNGAKKFILTTRKDKYDINNFDKDLDITVIKTNLLNYEEISQLLEEYDIDGIFHLAGMIKDKLAKDLDINDINDVLNIKK